MCKSDLPWDIQGLFLTGKSEKRSLQFRESHQTNFIGLCVNLPVGSYRLILFAFQIGYWC